MSEGISKNVSKYEQDSHLKIFDRTVNNDKFEGIHITGTFEEPALVFKMSKAPSQPVMNMLANSINRKNDKDYNMYLYVGKKGIKIGKLDSNIEKIYGIEELFNRYGLTIIEVKEGKKRIVTSSDFITTIQFDVGEEE